MRGFILPQDAADWRTTRRLVFGGQSCQPKNPLHSDPVQSCHHSRPADPRTLSLSLSSNKKVWIVWLCDVDAGRTISRCGVAWPGAALLQLTRLGKLHINEIGCYLIAAERPQCGGNGEPTLSVANNGAVVRGTGRGSASPTIVPTFTPQYVLHHHPLINFQSYLVTPLRRLAGVDSL